MKAKSTVITILFWAVGIVALRIALFWVPVAISKMQLGCFCK